MNKASAHRPWTKTVDELDLALARRERTLSKGLTFSYGATRYDAIVAAQKTAKSSVSRCPGGLKPGACGAPLRGFGA